MRAVFKSSGMSRRVHPQSESDCAVKNLKSKYYWPQVESQDLQAQERGLD